MMSRPQTAVGLTGHESELLFIHSPPELSRGENRPERGDNRPDSQLSRGENRLNY